MPPVGGATTDEVLPARSTRARLVTVAKVAFVVAAVALGVLYVAEHREEVARALRAMSWAAVLASALAVPVALACGMLATRAVLRDLGADLTVAAAGRLYFVSQIGKYLPGSVWPVLAQAELARRHGVDRRTSVAGSAVAILLSLVVGLVVAAVLLLATARDRLGGYGYGLLALVPLALLLHPGVLGPLLDRLLRLLRRPPLVRRPTSAGLLRAAGWQTANWLLLGLHVWLLAVAAGADARAALPVAVGGFALAFCLGVLFVPAPAGAGVRDAVLVVTLGAVTGTGVALTVSLLSRVMLAVYDLLLGVAWGALRVSPDRSVPGER